MMFFLSFSPNEGHLRSRAMTNGVMLSKRVKLLCHHLLKTSGFWSEPGQALSLVDSQHSIDLFQSCDQTHFVHLLKPTYFPHFVPAGCCLSLPSSFSSILISSLQGVFFGPGSSFAERSAEHLYIWGWRKHFQICKTMHRCVRIN